MKKLIAFGLASVMLGIGVFFCLSQNGLAWKGVVIQKDVLPALYTDITMPGEAYQSLAFFPVAYRVVFDSENGAVEVFLGRERFDQVKVGQVYHRGFRDRVMRPYVLVQPGSIPANQVIIKGSTDADSEIPR